MSYTISSLQKGLVLDMPLNSLLGTELISNGGFDSSTGWTLGSYWSISSGKANYVNTGFSTLYTTVTIKPTTRYLVSFDVSDTTGLYIRFGTSVDYWNSYATYTNGHYELSLSSNSSDTKFYVYANTSGGNGSIDNLSVKEILPNNQGTTHYESNFASSGDGWSGTRGTISGNIDSVSDGTTSKDDVLRYYANSTDSTHKIHKSVLASDDGNKRYHLTFSLYIPSGQTHVDGFWVYGATETESNSFTIGSAESVAGSWVDYDYVFTANTDFRKIFIAQKDGTGFSFAGADSSSDDTFYVKDLKISEVGSVDKTPGQNNGVVYGGTQNSDSMTFDGSDDKITISNSSELSFGDGSSDKPFSISAWVYVDNDNTFRILSKWDSSNNGEYTWGTNTSGNLGLWLKDNSSSTILGSVYSNFTGTENVWTHIAVTYNGGGSYTDIVHYVNGEEKSSIENSVGSYTAMEALGVDLVIAERADNSVFTDGTIKDVKLWNRVLSADEIKLLYKGASVRGII